MEKLWKIVDGKKTITGIVLLIIGFTQLAGLVTPEEATAIIDMVFTAFGLILTVVGLIHKIIKAADNDNNYIM